MQSSKTSMARSAGRSLSLDIPIGPSFAALLGYRDSWSTREAWDSYDGDPRASYLLLDEGIPSIRRVDYDMETELKALAFCGLPGAEWTATMLRKSSPQLP